MTPQQIANDLLAEHQANRKRNMTLSEHDLHVKPHLEFIASGAAMAARHARALPHKMAFTTHAQDELAEARRVLEDALAMIVAAEAIYEGKPLENAA